MSPIPSIREQIKTFRHQVMRPHLWASPLARRLGGILFLALLAAVLALGIMRYLQTRTRFEAFTLPYLQDFSQPVDLTHWFLQDGVWSQRNNALVEVANLEKPAQIFIPQKLASDQLYHLSVYITLSKSAEAAGINFNAQYPKLTQQLQQVYITRKPPSKGENTTQTGGMALVSGYTDATGGFVPQVSVPLAVDAKDYRLDLYVLGNTYTVQLNGQTMIERRPLFYTGGLLGFYTLGPATFDTIKVTTAENTEPGELVYVSDFDQTPGGAGWVPFGEDWELSQGEMVQVNPAQQESGIGYEGSAFENYVLQATFHHLMGSGGGLLFNMPSPYQLNGAHVVRYSEQTDSLFWGYFDSQGIFTRQGYQDVASPGTAPHQLRIFSGADSYDIYLDEKLIARGVPLQRSNGHIGLISARSSVAYSLVEVFPLFGGTPLPTLNTPLPAATVAPLSPTATSSITVSIPLTPTQPVTSRSTPTLKARATLTTTATPTPTSAPAAKEGEASPTRPARTATPLAITSRAVISGNSAALRGNLRSTDWKPISGQWRFDQGTVAQEQAIGFDQAIVYTRNGFRNYQLESTFVHTAGNGAGLLFNMPYGDRINGAYQVRFSERRPGGIFWGYFDETGKFVGQGYATVDPPGDQPHTLRVVSGPAAYSLYLDNVLLADNLPLIATRNYGYVGLIMSQSSAIYRTVQVNGLTTTPAASAAISNTVTSAQPFKDQRIVSGNWEVNKGVYTQKVPDPADYILNTGIFAGEYTAEAEITLPVKPDSSGGLVLHMAERGRKNGAFLVRLIRGGEAVFWGNYDESGAFRGRASTELPKNAEGVYHIKLTVRGNRLDISVDEQQVASNVLMPRNEGWIGLLAYGGPITFRNVKITVGLAQ